MTTDDEMVCLCEHPKSSHYFGDRPTTHCQQSGCHCKQFNERIDYYKEETQAMKLCICGTGQRIYHSARCLNRQVSLARQEGAKDEREKQTKTGMGTLARDAYEKGAKDERIKIKETGRQIFVNEFKSEYERGAKDEHERLSKPSSVGSCQVCGSDDAVVKAYAQGAKDEAQKIFEKLESIPIRYYVDNDLYQLTGTEYRKLKKECGVEE